MTNEIDSFWRENSENLLINDKMTNEQIINLGWTEISESYFSLKEFDDSSRKEGFEYKLSVFPRTIMIESFPINYGISAGDSAYNYDCNIIFKGKINNTYDLKTLMGYLEIPANKNLIEKSSN